MYLSDETKELLSKRIGIPYDQLIKMDEEDIIAYIEKKNGTKMSFSKPSAMQTGSGDDSVLIDSGRFISMDDVDKRIDEIIKHHKSKSAKKQSTPIAKEDDDTLSPK